jgi:glyoxylase-like metal-dependent hydrolase (beta-lactamase superfamily II)
MVFMTLFTYLFYDVPLSIALLFGLIYDLKSKEAALIDVGGPVDSLITHIENNNLKLKYIFATHSHLDHIEGVPEVRQKFPDARFCINKEDFQNFIGSEAWIEKNFGLEKVEELAQDPFFKIWFDYDTAILGGIDIYLEDNQVYKLGKTEIRTILSPGHSSGSICFHTGNALFSGDVLFYENVGRTDFIGGSGEVITESVRNLYTRLPDETIVYPGHGKFTDIGYEKTKNKEVSVDEVNLNN